MPRSLWTAMIGHALDGLPDEACGLLGGSVATATATVFVPCANADHSSKTFSLGPECWLAADAEIGDLGMDIVGVVHSHTHTEAYPSPTDVREAANPMLEGWRWVIVSLKRPEAAVRSFVITGEEIAEEEIVLAEG
jgi:proteasome lid subunit RPN8/RPN11